MAKATFTFIATTRRGGFIAQGTVTGTSAACKRALRSMYGNNIEISLF